MSLVNYETTGSISHIHMITIVYHMGDDFRSVIS